MMNLITKLKAMNVAGLLATLAAASTVMGANAVCTCIFHEPEKPDLTRFRRF